MKSIEKKLLKVLIGGIVLLGIIYLLARCTVEVDQRRKKPSVQSEEKKKIVIQPKEGKEITTGYIRDNSGQVVWKVAEVEYDGERYIILYPKSRQGKIIMTKK